MTAIDECCPTCGDQLPDTPEWEDRHIIDGRVLEVTEQYRCASCGNTHRIHL